LDSLRKRSSLKNTVGIEFPIGEGCTEAYPFDLMGKRRMMIWQVMEIIIHINIGSMIPG
jgi:hypothetical protein